MANITTLIQGAALADWFEVDLSEAGTLTAVKIEVGQNGVTVLDFRYPTETGYPIITKDGDSYSISLTTAQTSTLSGLYEVEVTGFNGTSEVFKSNYSQNGADVYLQINPEMK